MLAILAEAKHSVLLSRAFAEETIVFTSYSPNNYLRLRELNSLGLSGLIISEGIGPAKELNSKLAFFKGSNPGCRIMLIRDNSDGRSNYIAQRILSNVDEIFLRSGFASVEKEVEALCDMWRGKMVGKHEEKRILKSPLKHLDLQVADKKQKLIAFLNLTPQAGSTTVASSYAEYLVAKGLLPAFLEPPYRPEAYYRFQLEGNEKDRFFCSYHNLAETGKYDGRLISQRNGVLWIVANPELGILESWSIGQTLALMESAKAADYLIWDIGSQAELAGIKELLPLADYTVCLYQAYPWQIYSAEACIKRFLRLREHNSRTLFVLNKYLPELETIYANSLPLPCTDFKLPVLDEVALYQAAKSGRSAYAERKNKLLLEPFFNDIRSLTAERDRELVPEAMHG